MADKDNIPNEELDDTVDLPYTPPDKWEEGTDPLDGEPMDPDPIYYRSHIRNVAVPPEYGFRNLQELVDSKSDKGHKHLATSIIQDPEHRFVTDEQIARWDRGPIYDNDTPIYWDHGGIKEGQTFEDLTMQDMFNMILYPYMEPDVSGTIVTTEPGVYELGSTVNVTEIHIHTKRRSNDITDIQICHGSTVDTSHNTDVAKGGDFVVSCNISLKSDTTIFTKVYDDTNYVVRVDLGSYTFANPIYFGSLAIDTTPTQTQIKDLTKKVIVPRERVECEFNCNYSRITFAYPADWGDLASIRDMNGLDLTDTFTVYTVNVTCSDNTSREYKVLVNNRSTVTKFKIRFQW